MDRYYVCTVGETNREIEYYIPFFVVDRDNRDESEIADDVIANWYGEDGIDSFDDVNCEGHYSNGCTAVMVKIAEATKEQYDILKSFI